MLVREWRANNKPISEEPVPECKSLAAERPSAAEMFRTHGVTERRMTEAGFSKAGLANPRAMADALNAEPTLIAATAAMMSAIVRVMAPTPSFADLVGCE